MVDLQGLTPAAGRGRLRALPRPSSFRERVVGRPRQDDILLLSAGLGFYGLVSIAPLGILVLWVSSLVLGEQRIHELANALARIGPKELGLDRILKRVGDQGTGAGVAAIVTGLWPASAYGAGLSRAFNRLSSGRKTEMRGLLGQWGHVVRFRHVEWATPESPAPAESRPSPRRLPPPRARTPQRGSGPGRVPKGRGPVRGSLHPGLPAWRRAWHAA